MPLPRLAILGATSQLARDFIAASLAAARYDFLLYARDPGKVNQWLQARGLTGRAEALPLSTYGETPHDVAMNFIGVGDPAKAVAMGEAILDTTEASDLKVLAYISTHPGCRYIFLSSGAVYGDFSTPASAAREAQIAEHPPKPSEHYAHAKWEAECRHRAHSELPIVDLRVFNYFSRTQDLSARFLIADILRALRDDTVFQTSAEDMVRDFLHPKDFCQMIDRIIAARPMNMAIDCYSAAPIEKRTLIEALDQRFGLRCEIVGYPVGVTATGNKSNYYSTHRRAAGIGYAPAYRSLDTVCEEAAAIMASHGLAKDE